MYHFSNYSIDDVDKILELYKIAFPNSYYTKDDILWKFNDNAYKTNRLLNLWKDEELIGHVNLLVSDGYVNGEKALVCCSGDFMANPKYPGIGQKLLKQCKEENSDINVIYGFPNENAYLLTLRLGHMDIGKLRVFEKEIDTQKELANGYISEMRGYFEKVTQIPSDIVCLTNVYRDKVEIITKRDKDYLEWRIFRHPTKNYDVFLYYINQELGGYIVLNTYQNDDGLSTQIIDILGRDDDAYYDMLTFVEKYAYEKKCMRVRLILSFSELQKILLKTGYNHSSLKFNMTSWNREFSIDQSYFTMIDLDIF